MIRLLALALVVCAAPAWAQGPGLPGTPPQVPGTPPPGEPPGLPGTPPQVPGTPPPGEPPGLPGAPPQIPSSALRVDVRLVLQGAASGGATMRTDIEALLPTAQPYAGAPWNHAGTEALATGLTDRHAVVDWVLVCLRPTPAADNESCTAALLLADGSLMSADETPGAAVPNAPATAHVVVYHRNHLALMSGASVLAQTVDLTDPVNVQGGASAGDMEGGRLALVAGDGDADGRVLAPDRQAVWQPQVGMVGYRAGDFALDGRVLADDRQTLWQPNVGRQTAVPSTSVRASVEP